MEEWPQRWTDPFTLPALGDRWVGGHYNQSRECRIRVGDGLHIEFDEGQEYASAGVVTREPVLGDFDARVRFAVASPAQGTTFELAAITIDGPRSSALELDASTADTRSRVYDVHGAPPYVSSEFDENDGWRIGWNRSAAQGRTQPDGSVVSDNHFNRYGRDSGPKPTGPAEGWLRLLRIASTWTAFRLDADGATWQPTGEVRHMNMPEAVFLRLAAKHWVKTRLDLTRAPANHVVFRDFVLAQPH